MHKILPNVKRSPLTSSFIRFPVSQLNKITRRRARGDGVVIAGMSDTAKIAAKKIFDFKLHEGFSAETSGQTLE